MIDKLFTDPNFFEETIHNYRIRRDNLKGKIMLFYQRQYANKIKNKHAIFDMAPEIEEEAEVFNLYGIRGNT